jgi:hypothetical protein
LRVGEWLQQIAHLNIFKHAEKNDDEPATSLQLGHNSYNWVKIHAAFVACFIVVVIVISCMLHVLF